MKYMRVKFTYMYALRQFQSNDSWIVHRLEPTNRLVHMIKKMN